MHVRLPLLLPLFVLALTANAKTEPVDYVSTLVGSDSNFELSAGNTYPAVAMPWGLNFWSPQTGKNGDGWQYSYQSNRIRGFKQTHQPSPWINDYGVFSLMPEVGTPVFDEEKRQSWFSHKSEGARPYYYSVYLADYDVVTELAPTERAAIFRFTYPRSDSAYLVLDAYEHGSYVKVIPSERKIIGYSTYNHGGVPDNFRCYFVLVFDKPFTFAATVNDGLINAASLETGNNHAGGVVGFKTKKGEMVTVRVASSFISEEQAERNLTELGTMTFDEVKAQGRQRWNEVLSRISVEDDNLDHLRTFYSCLYRTLLFPRKFYEIDAQGQPVHYSPYNGRVEKGYIFTDTGFWDTFRALFPLVNLVYPEMGRQMAAGLANAYRESGYLPGWASPGHRDCMVGNNSASIAADAVLKGLVSDDDAATLWEAVCHDANSVHPRVSSTGRLGYEWYNRLGYVPYDVGINENVARTLEYSYDDWCIYQLGRALGKKNRELRDYRKRALNYQNVFDKTTGMMRGRLKDGSFQRPFSPFKWGDAFTEGNSWHWTWCVFHDPEGLITLMGGRDRFNQKMDSVFTLPPIYDDSYYGFPIHEIREMQIMNMGQYAHGNQPIQHMLYLYDYSGQPWKAQYWIREVMERLYTAAPDGYCGDEDNGQTSAWYVFSALGMYPVCPVSQEYALGTPYFRQVTITLADGKKVKIKAENMSADTRYVASMTLNGRPYDLNYLRYADLKDGADITFSLSPTPNKQRGASPEAAPYSFSR